MICKLKNQVCQSIQIDKLYTSYLKPSFDLGIHVIQIFFQYIITLVFSFNLDVLRVIQSI
jgi:hypothetical protein